MQQPINGKLFSLRVQAVELEVDPRPDQIQGAIQTIAQIGHQRTAWLRGMVDLARPLFEQLGRDFVEPGGPVPEDR